MRNQTWIPNPIKRSVSISSGGKCHHCKKKADFAIKDGWNIIRFREANGTPFEFDHLLPVSFGGKTTIKNIVLSCRSCNRKKSRITIEEKESMNKILNAFPWKHKLPREKK